MVVILIQSMKARLSHPGKNEKGSLPQFTFTKK